MRRRAQIAATLRARIERAIASHALTAGDRLPSTRTTASEMSADPRVVSSAYRQLEAEGLVEMRPRSGVYVAGPATDDFAGRKPPIEWLARILANGVSRGFSTRDLCDLLRDAATSRTITVAVVATTRDQTAGMCRELRTAYGLIAVEVLAETLQPRARLPAAMRRAHFFLTTAAHGDLVKKLAEHLHKPFIVAAIRPQLGDNWLRLMKRQVFVIATDERFLALLRQYLRETPGYANVRMLLAGRDDISGIPVDAPTYVTHAARERLGKTLIPGWLVPAAPIFAPDCVREIMDIIVRLNTQP